MGDAYNCSNLNIAQINQIDNKFILSLPRPDKNTGEPDYNKLTLVDSNFYNKYIKPNKGLFQEWNPNNMDGKILNSEEDYANVWTSRHYFFGKIELPDNLCRIIIYEYFIVNHSENKLFMLVIDSLGNLLYVDKVAESTDYPGAYYYEYSILRSNDLVNYQVTDDYLSNYDEEKEEPISQIDSVTTIYKWTKENKYYKVSRDSITYLKK